jgi:hypothetical protein
MWLLTPFLSSQWHSTLYNCASVALFCMPNVGDVGDVFAAAVTAGDGLPAGSDGRLAHWQNSWESHPSLSSNNNAAEMINRIIRMLYPFLLDVIKSVLIKAVLTIVRLCYHLVLARWVDSSVNYVEEIVDIVGIHQRERKKENPPWDHQIHLYTHFSEQC